MRSLPLRLSCGFPAAVKASLLGARQVTFAAVSRVCQRLVFVRATPRELRDDWPLIVLEQGAGGFRTLGEGWLGWEVLGWMMGAGAYVSTSWK